MNNFIANKIQCFKCHFFKVSFFIALQLAVPICQGMWEDQQMEESFYCPSAITASPLNGSSYEAVASCDGPLSLGSQKYNTL